MLRYVEEVGMPDVGVPPQPSLLPQGEGTPYSSS